MFAENPSMKSMLDGLMSREGLTIYDFKSFFGFDRIKSGLPFEILQASTLVYAQKVWFNHNCLAPEKENRLSINSHRVYLYIDPKNTAMIYMDMEDGTDIRFKYTYTSDNFPAIEIVMKNSECKVIYHIRELVPGCGIDDGLIIDWSSTIVEYLTRLLYVAYMEMHK